MLCENERTHYNPLAYFMVGGLFSSLPIRISTDFTFMISRQNRLAFHCLDRVALGFLVVFFRLFCGSPANAQTEISVDGSYIDWSSVPVLYSSPPGTGAPGQIDFGTLQVANDQDFVFFRIELGKEIIIQENNNLQLLIDTDSNASTGFSALSIGAELVWRFGQRQGTVYRSSGNTNIEHPDVKLRTAPTVSSSVYEIAVGRTVSISGQPLFTGSNIRVALRDGTSGDRIPLSGQTLTYTIQSGSIPAEPASFTRLDVNDLRVMSWNTRQDGLWDSTAAPRFGRILQASQPDIICFQEIYGHNGTETASFVQQYLPGTWYNRSNSDCKSLSRLQVLGSWSVPGSSIMLVNTNTKFGIPTLIVNSHLLCCDNDSGRQNQIDSLLAFIRDAKQPGGNPSLAENTPIVIVGDMNLVTYADQLEALLTGEIFDPTTHGSSFAPDWDETPFANLFGRHSDSREAYSWRSDTSSYAPGKLDFHIYSDSVLDIPNHFLVNTEAMTASRLSTLGLQWNDSWASDHMAFVADYRLHVEEPEYATLAGSFLFHNGWSGTPSGTPSDAIDPNKVLVNEGTGPQALTLNNLISTTQGLNGLGFDIQDPWNPAGITAADFAFQVSPQGAFNSGANPPTSWATAHAPQSVTVVPGSPTRILIQWPNGVIANRWLRVTVLANDNTGLEHPEVFYIGHLLGEVTEASNGVWNVTFGDVLPIRAVVGAQVGPGSNEDIDKNGTISFTDISAMRVNIGAELTNVTVP